MDSLALNDHFGTGSRQIVITSLDKPINRKGCGPGIASIERMGVTYPISRFVLLASAIKPGCMQAVILINLKIQAVRDMTGQNIRV